MKKYIIIPVFIFFTVIPLLAATTGNPIGKVYQKNAGLKEIVVSIPKAAEKYQMGDKLAVEINGEEVVMTVTFPMMTIAKARLLPKYNSYFDKITAGMPVYRYSTGEKFAVRYYKNYDKDYLNTYRKVKFIEEVSKKDLKITSYYFEVQYDAKNFIVKTTEVKDQKKTVVDYYKDDVIIKKEWFQPGGEKLEKLNVYDYYDNLTFRETGEYDYINNTKKVARYDENGNIISDESGPLDDNGTDSVRTRGR